MTNFDPSALPPIRDWLRATYPSSSERRVSSYVTANATLASAAALTSVFFPSFTIYRGCYLIRDSGIDQPPLARWGVVDEWYDHFNGDLSAVESMVNHLHPSDLFINDPNVDQATLDYLVDVLAFSWKVSATQQFPDQAFETRTERGFEPEVTIYAVRD